MLHISQEERLKIIKDRINQYNIRFPVATLNKVTGEDMGNLSKMLKGKKTITDKVYTSFTEEYPEKKNSQIKIDMDHILPLGDLKITLKDYFNLLMEQKIKAEEREKEYLEIIKTKLISIDSNSKEMAEDIEALTTEIQAEHRAMMDSIDVAAEQPIGTTRAAAHSVELASEQGHVNMGKKAGKGKQS